MTKKINHDDLVYRYKGKSPNENFDEYDNALDIINKIQNGEIKLSNVKITSRWNKKGSNKRRSKEQKKALYNIEILYKGRNEAIKFFDDYSLKAFEAKIKPTKGTGVKILTPKQTLQRLPIAL